MSVPQEENEMIKAVRDSYTKIASNASDSTYSSKIAQAFGYSPEELQSVPKDSHMGLSCGNPVATAGLRKGENVLDLGSGGGIDVLLAASKVGPDGHAIGIDMSSAMISRARTNARNQNLAPPRVAFVEAALTENLPIISESTDCVISNCVVNLLPNDGKKRLIREVFRVLKPGGRLVFDDIVAKRRLPEAILGDLASYVGCISGATQLDHYRELLHSAGFDDMLFSETQGDINIYRTAKAQCCIPSRTKSPSFEQDPPTATDLHYDANEWVASYQIYALRPLLSQSKSQNNQQVSPLQRWWDAYPSVKTISLPSITREDLVQLLKDQKEHDFAVIDVRGSDHGGGHIRGSFQRPAQSFHTNLPEFYTQFKDVPKVIFYCGSSNGRGPRCAGWYQDYLGEQGNHISSSMVLKSGIKGFLELYHNDNLLIDT